MAAQGATLPRSLSGLKRGITSAMTKKTIVVVEDDKNTGAMLATALREAGYYAICADSIAAASRLLKGRRPDLLVLDLNISEGNGLELCRKVRADRWLSTAPIIALTEMGEPHYKVKGFPPRAAQHHGNPPEVREFVLWVTALLLRAEIGKDGMGLTAGTNLSINMEAQIVLYRGHIVKTLTKREFDLFVALVKKSPRILSRKQILSSVWHTVAVENLIDAHIFNIRQKVPRELAAKIQSVSGRGFRYFDSSTSLQDPQAH